MKGGEDMKEASGEANMTIVTIILIGVIVAVVTPLVTNMMNDTKGKAACTSKGMCCPESGACNASTCVVCPD